jgi:hypothetical protein
MNRHQPGNELSRADEKHLIRIATNAIETDFQNPDRLGCPEATSIRAIVRRDLSMRDAEDIIDHVATCAPCFREYTRQRRKYFLRRRGGIALACVVGVIAAAFGWHYRPTSPAPEKQTIAKQSPEPTLTTILDFQNRTVQRSAEPQQPTPPAAPHLKRALLNLVIKLPIGVEDGIYTVQLLAGKERTVIDTTGSLAWDGSAETLITTVDLRRLAPGQYTLVVVAKDGSWWHTYAVLLD